MAIQGSFPNEYPSLMLDFANTKKLDPRITFTRASTATFYDGETVAKAEENLFIYSEQFDNAGWVKYNTTVTANTSVAPDGTTTADTITGDSINLVKAIGAANMGAYATPAAARTVSVYAKAGTNNFIQIFFNGDGTPWANFDLSAGTVGSTGSNQTASIVSVGSGWYRCILYTASTTATTCNLGIISSSTAARAEPNTLTTTILLWGAQLEQRSAVTAYTVTTTQPITNYIPVLLTAASGVPRFDHNPTTSESLGLEIEEQRTNLQTYSEQFDNAAWNKTNATITANTIVAPDGTLTGDKLVETTANNFHFISPVSSGTTVSTTYTASIYVKAAERTWFVLTAFGVVNTDTWFNLSTGVSGTTGSSVLSKSITPVGNGWYRCSITYVATGTNSGVSALPATADGVSIYTGNGFSGVYIWGAQLEAGAFATSYIATVASQVTRSADAASITGTNFSQWYNQNEGTVYTETFNAQTVPASTFPGVWRMNDGANNNRISLYITSSSANVGVVKGGSAQSTVANSVTTANAYFKNAYVYKTNDFAMSTNAGTVGTAASGGIPVLTQFLFSSGDEAGKQLWHKKLAYYPLRLTNAELQGLTS